jgi:anti-sigma regulatory factor (Ser/Thr protein kinase)
VRYSGLEAAARPCGDPLPEPAGDVEELGFEESTVPAVRALVRGHVTAARLPQRKADGLLLAVTELAANSVRHGGGHGLLRVWHEPGTLMAEISDAGRLDLPLAGRRRPETGQRGGYGLWVVHQVCDLVQIRSSRGGTTVRVHTSTRG